MRRPSAWWAGPLIGGLVLGQFLFEPWWRFPLATLGILLIAQLGYGRDGWQRLGLVIPRWHAAAALALLATLYGLSLWLQALLAGLQGLSYMQPTGTAAWLWQTGLLFQVLNEEILLRALLLGWLKRKLRSERLIMLVTTAVFAGLHILLYLFLADVSLAPGPLLTLLIYCLIANLLFLRSGHIAFAFALHAGWNLNRFTAVYVDGSQRLSEAQTFNAIEGKLWPWMLGLWLLLMWFLRSHPTQAKPLDELTEKADWLKAQKHL